MRDACAIRLKNTLESYVFSTRSKIREHEEDLEKVSTDEEREKIMEDLEGIEDWLYEDGEEGGANAPIDAYKEKRKKMDERVNAIFFRHAELEARPKAVETARIILEAAKHKTSAWITERPQVSEDDRKQVLKMIEDIGKWLDEKEKKQEGLEKTATPAFTSSDVKSQIRPLNRLMGRMLAKKVDEPVDPTKKMKRNQKLRLRTANLPAVVKLATILLTKRVTTLTRRRRVARMNCKLNACMRCRTHFVPL